MQELVFRERQWRASLVGVIDDECHLPQIGLYLGDLHFGGRILREFLAVRVRIIHAPLHVVVDFLDDAIQFGGIGYARIG